MPPFGIFDFLAKPALPAKAGGPEEPPGHAVPSIEEIENAATALANVSTSILAELRARGQRDGPPDIQGGLAMAERVLSVVAKVWPPAGTAEAALRIFGMIDRLTAPSGPIVADGRGGWVPSSNSSYDPKTGRFSTGPFHG